MKSIFGLLFLFITVICCFSCSKEDSISPEVAEVEYYQFNIEVNQEIPTDQKVAMVLREIHSGKNISYAGRIERRGGFSISFPKHSYEIDLEKDVSIGNLPEDDDWILNANYIDKTFMRHAMSYELFLDMHPNNKAAEIKYAELELNEAYYGLFVLMEKLDKSSLGVNKEDPNAVIFKEPPLFRFNIDEYVPQYSDNFHQQTYPDKDDQDMTPFIEGLRKFIVDSSDSLFCEKVPDIFDINNIIDWHLLILLSNNNDGILKNFYLYKVDSNTPLRVAPWDYDHSFGRDGDGELNLIRKQCDPQRSILFKRLLKIDWYKTALKRRWKELNELNLFTPEGIKTRINNYRIILDGLVEKNF